MVVRKTGEYPDFIGLVQGSHFGGLGNRNDLGLDVMLVADAVVGMADQVDGEFAVAGVQRDQFATCELLGSAALVAINVGRGGADHRVVGLGERLQAQAVRAGSVEDNEDL